MFTSYHPSTIDYAALARAMHWMWRWIGEHWARDEWRNLSPARVAGEALHAWQHSDDNPARYKQGEFLL